MELSKKRSLYYTRHTGRWSTPRAELVEKNLGPLMRVSSTLQPATLTTGFLSGFATSGLRSRNASCVKAGRGAKADLTQPARAAHSDGPCSASTMACIELTWNLSPIWMYHVGTFLYNPDRGQSYKFYGDKLYDTCCTALGPKTGPPSPARRKAS